MLESVLIRCEAMEQLEYDYEDIYNYLVDITFKALGTPYYEEIDKLCQKYFQKINQRQETFPITVHIIQYKG